MKFFAIPKWNFSWLGLAKIWLKVIVLTFALQPALIIYKSDFFSGLFNSFTVFSLSAFDFLVMLLVVSLGLAFCFREKKENEFVKNFSFKFSNGWLGLLIWILFLIMTLSVFFAEDKVLALLNLFRWLELLLVLAVMVNGLISRDEVIRYFLYGLSIQALLAVLQFINQSWLGLKFLGEPNIDKFSLNVAKIDVGDSKWMRAYGTFSHPNILAAAGVFGLALVLLKSLGKSKKLIYFLPIAIILLLSFSRTAWLAVLILIISLIVQGEFKINWNYILGGITATALFLVIFNLGSVVLARLTVWDDQALLERSQLFNVSLGMVQKNFFGVGLGNYILEMPKFVTPEWANWLYQPVHNVFLLVLAELGVAGALVLLVLLFLYFKKMLDVSKDGNKLKAKEAKIFFGLGVAVLIMAMFDHYFYTSLQGQFLIILMLYFGLTIEKTADSH